MKAEVANEVENLAKAEEMEAKVGLEAEKEETVDTAAAMATVVISEATEAEVMEEARNMLIVLVPEVYLRVRQ